MAADAETLPFGLSCSADFIDPPSPEGENVNIDAPGLRLNILNGSLWPSGKKLRIKFVNQTDPKLIERIKQTVKIYEDLTSINFWWVGPNDTAEIRIKTGLGLGHSSIIGVHALNDDVLRSDCTMTLGAPNVSVKSDQADFDRVVLHEFGHMLGCVHEHTSPLMGTLEWDKKAVEAYYTKSPNNWTLQEIENNIYKRYSNREVTNSGTFDHDSIMLYEFPATMFKNGQFWTKRNTKLSATDIAFLQKAYPKVGTRAQGEWNHNSFYNDKLRNVPQRVALPQLDPNPSTTVTFTTPYHLPPNIITGINALEIKKDADFNFLAKAERITEDNFVLSAETSNRQALGICNLTYIEAEPKDLDMQVGTFTHTLAKGEDWYRYKKIRFPRNFVTKPQIMFWISGINAVRADQKSDEDFRLDVTLNYKTATSGLGYEPIISETGFEISMFVSNFVHKSMTISWIAYTKDKDIATGDRLVGDYQTVGSKTSFTYGKGHVAFEKGQFDSPPRVFTGVNRLRMKTNQDMNFIVDVTDVTEEGFDYEVESWGGSEFRRIEFSWVAFP